MIDVNMAIALRKKHDFSFTAKRFQEVSSALENYIEAQICTLCELGRSQYTILNIHRDLEMSYDLNLSEEKKIFHWFTEMLASNGYSIKLTKSWEVQDDENLCISWEEKK